MGPAKYRRKGFLIKFRMGFGKRNRFFVSVLPLSGIFPRIVGIVAVQIVYDIPRKPEACQQQYRVQLPRQLFHYTGSRQHGIKLQKPYRRDHLPHGQRRFYAQRVWCFTGKSCRRYADQQPYGKNPPVTGSISQKEKSADDQKRQFPKIELANILGGKFRIAVSVYKQKSRIKMIEIMLYVQDAVGDSPVVDQSRP